MLDVSHIADLLVSEVDALAQTVPLQGKSPEERRQTWLGVSPLPDRSSLEAVLTTLLWASTLSEEGRQCRPRLLYEKTPQVAFPFHRFEKPVALTRDTLRKKTFAHGSRGYLSWRSDDGLPVLTGIAPRFGAPHFPNLILSAPAPMAADVLWFATRVLIVRNGETLILSNRGLPSLREALSELGHAFNKVLEPKLLGAALQAIVDGGHGGAIWIANTARGVPAVDTIERVDSPFRIVARAFPSADEQEPWLQSVGHLAAVDGAVVIDIDFNVLGFGAFVEAKECNVLARQADGSSKPVLSSTLGGGRHRSAISYCVNNAPAAALGGSESCPWVSFVSNRDA